MSLDEDRERAFLVALMQLVKIEREGDHAASFDEADLDVIAKRTAYAFNEALAALRKVVAP